MKKNRFPKMNYGEEEKGSKTQDIKKAIAAGTMKPQEIADKFGTTLSSVYTLKYQMKKKGEIDTYSRVKGAAPEDTSDVQIPEETEAMTDDKREMVGKYGKTAVDRALSMYVVGNDADRIAGAVDLKEDQVQEILDRCI